MAISDSEAHAELVDAAEALGAVFETAADGALDLPPLLQQRLLDLLEDLWVEVDAYRWRPSEQARVSRERGQIRERNVA